MNSKSLNVSSPNFWDNKYSNNEHSWDIGKPTPIFKNWASNIENKSKYKICIPGCGYGHDIIYLSRIGFDVYGFDFSSEAVNHIKEFDSKLNVQCVDFFQIDNKYNKYFDFILEYTFYCAIDPIDRARYVRKCYNLLKDKGKIIGIMLPIYNENKDFGPPFEVYEEELILNFQNKFNILKIKKNNFSIEKRKNIELYVEYEKK